MGKEHSRIPHEPLSPLVAPIHAATENRHMCPQRQQPEKTPDGHHVVFNGRH